MTEERSNPVRASEVANGVDSPYAWARLAAALALGTIGGVGMWSYVVVLPSVQAEFQVSRAMASMPYAAIMLGFGFGGILIGRISDRIGIFLPILMGATMLGAGYVLAGIAPNLWLFVVAHGLLVGLLGSATVFGPLMADTSRWFLARRGLAVGICASGNYVAGTVWPPVVQHFVETTGWRTTYIWIGIFCFLAMLPLAFVMRRPAPRPAMIPVAAGAGLPAGAGPTSPLSGTSLSPNTIMALLLVAGFGCCMAMAMPQVHLVAYCGDLGYGPARGAQMLSLMMAMGVVSRLLSGWICDHIGGFATLLTGSVLQGIALLLYMSYDGFAMHYVISAIFGLFDLPFDGLASLYVISAMFGLFQGGIVPSYTIIVREVFPAHEAGYRIGFVLFATLVGMALGGWASGRIFDVTGSYRAAFAHGVFWNLVNGVIVLWLMLKLRRPGGTTRLAMPLAGTT
jgi:MFS family permease